MTNLTERDIRAQRTFIVSCPGPYFSRKGSGNIELFQQNSIIVYFSV